MNLRQQQSGVALITAILLVAMATLLTTKLAWDYQISLRRTEAIIMQEQARFFAVGAEAVAIAVLKEDEVVFDHAGDYWDDDLDPIPIGIDEIVMGTMDGQLHDAQGRFNVNNLIPVRGAGPDQSSRDQFARLIDNLQLSPSIVDAVIDWIDEDTIPLPNGAEDSIYTSLDPPYRPANNYFTSVSELRAVANIDNESYAALLPHVTAIHPNWCGTTGGITPININSASVEVIQSLHANIDRSQAEAWYTEPDEAGWDDMNQIPGWPAAYNSLPGTPATIKTNCFGLDVLVNVGSSVLSMYSLLDRSLGADKIVTRVRIFGLDRME
jgi:general secretion pathway protein K